MKQYKLEGEFTKFKTENNWENQQNQIWFFKKIIDIKNMPQCWPKYVETQQPISK